MGQYNGVRQEIQEYRTMNEKWKKYQFEHWKSMGKLPVAQQFQQPAFRELAADGECCPAR